MSRGQDFEFGPDPFAGTFAPDVLALVTDQPLQISDSMMDDTAEETIGLSSLSNQQEIILIVFHVSAATLSLIGSCTIVFKILRSLSRNQRTTPYDRIILGLSGCDIVSSCTFAMGPFLLPSETSHWITAIGDDTTCQKLGFLTQLACMWAVWYNCILSFYYLLTVRFKVKRQEFVQKYEKWLHFSGVIFFPVTAVVGLVGDWYEEEDLAITCWIGGVVTGCDESGNNCTGDYGEVVAYILSVPILVTILAVIINNLIIYVFVRKSLLFSVPPVATDDTPVGTGDSVLTRESMDSVSEGQSIQERLTKEAAIQGFLYVSTFLVTILPAFTIQVLDGTIGYGPEDRDMLYPLLLWNSMVLPLQGFFNVFIYIRPSYSRFSAANPENTSWVSLKQAIFDPNIPRMSSTHGVTSNPVSAIDKKHSEMKRRCGSNFSASLHNIIEEHGEDDSLNNKNEDGSTAESFYTESHSAHGSQKQL